jgi:hypothetical protein
VVVHLVRRAADGPHRPRVAVPSVPKATLVAAPLIIGSAAHDLSWLWVSVPYVTRATVLAAPPARRAAEGPPRLREVGPSVPRVEAVAGHFVSWVMNGLPRPRLAVHL